MEIDHADSDHENWDVANLRPICHICHLAKHPVQPGISHFYPLRPIFLPELSQSLVSALAWSIIWGQQCARLTCFGERDKGWDVQRAFELDMMAEKRQHIFADLGTWITQRCVEAQKCTGQVDGKDGIAAMLCISEHLGRTPENWEQLRWWPTAAGVDDLYKDAAILCWLPGAGVATVWRDIPLHDMVSVETIRRISTAAAELRHIWPGPDHRAD